MLLSILKYFLDPGFSLYAMTLIQIEICVSYMDSNVILQETQAKQLMEEDSSQQQQSEQQPENDSGKKEHILRHNLKDWSYKCEIRAQDLNMHILNTSVIA